MSSDWETEERQRFQREQQRDRQAHSDKARRESQDRQDERDRKRRHDQQSRDAQRRQDRERSEQARAEERERQREHGHELYERKRGDRLADAEMKRVMTIEEEKEISRREAMLLEMGAGLYRQKLDADYAHDVRTRNLDIQELQKRSQIETESEIRIANNAARNDRKEIKERLKASIMEKLVDHKVSEAAKQSAHEQELDRMAAESIHRTTEIREESAAKEREEWNKNEVRKDFEEFMVKLRVSTGRMSTEEIEQAIADLKRAGKL